MSTSSYIDFTLETLRLFNRYYSKSKERYFKDMVEFFLDVKDPADLDELTERGLLSGPYGSILERTAKLSGLQDRRMDKNGNDYWVEEQPVMG